MAARTRVLFVCLGNICRSPLARALFEQAVTDRGLNHQFIIDSAGTSGLHAGEGADRRTVKNAQKNGLIFSHTARQFQEDDFDRFDHIIVMDRSNYDNVKKMGKHPEHYQKIRLMREWDNDAQEMEVPDPWYGGDDGFEEVFRILERSTSNLLTHLS